MGKIHSGGEVSHWIVLLLNNNNNNNNNNVNDDDDNNNNSYTYIRQTKKSKFI